jgi:inner membrane protein
MDSLTQIALGSAVGVAVMGRRTAAWKAALWGAIGGTLPDLDAFINHGDAILNMTRHRAESHALFVLTLAAPVLAWIVSRVHGEAALFRRWWLAMWLVLITHPLLDTMTVYGTQLLQPFSDYPFAVGSVFIIDLAYTLPLIVGVVAALRLKSARGLAWNTAGLVLSTLYLGWSVGAQQHVTRPSTCWSRPRRSTPCSGGWWPPHPPSTARASTRCWTTARGSPGRCMSAART